MPQSKTKSIFLAGTIAGTLDILGAFLVYSVIMKVAPLKQILQSIASGIFGKDAYTCNPMIPLIGLFLHYCIAFAFAVFYFLIYPKVRFLHKNKIVSGLLYGIFVWMVMNLGVLEIVFPNHKIPAADDALIGISILMLMFGLPIAWIADRHYSRVR
jgi:hypothetical protein